MIRPVLWPTVPDYEQAIIELEGMWTVCEVYYGTNGDAAIQRRRMAERWVREDARIAKEMGMEMHAA